MANLRGIVVGITLTLASVAVTLAMAEAALRFTPYAKLRKPDYSYPTGYFAADAELGVDIIPNVSGKMHQLQDIDYALFSNRYGCFDYERDVPEDYTLILGDSQTWGYAPLEHKWTTKLEKLSGKFMLKCGVTGYGTLQELRKAQRVAGQVGHVPERLIALYVSNDFNDDFFFPQRTVYAGKLIGWIDSLDLDTGAVDRRTLDEIAEKNAKFEEGSLTNHLREWRHGFVTYRLFKLARERVKLALQGMGEAEEVKAAASPKKAESKQPKQLPHGRIESIYHVSLVGYLDTDRPWFNAAFEAHSRNIIALADYADSIGAKLLFVDPYGLLKHRRFDRVRERLGKGYYNLQADYYPHDTWENDGHWNIAGNRKAAEHIYRHAQRMGFFED